jgi:hypothetical protein
MNYRKERYQFKSIEESCGQGPFCGLHAKVLKRMPKCKVKILRKQIFIMSTLFFLKERMFRRDFPPMSCNKIIICLCLTLLVSLKR